MACWVLAGLVASSSLAPAAEAPVSGLADGQQIKVEGHARPDGSFEAVQVVLRDFDRTSKVEGRVSTVRSDRRGFHILGFDVTLSNDTSLYRGATLGASRAEIAAGRWVEVKGTARGRTLVAERVRIKDAPEATEELEGVVERVGTPEGTVMLLGRTVWLPTALQIVDERRGEAAPPDSRLRRDVDDQSRDPWRLGSRVLVGGRLDNSWTQARNYDLAPTADQADTWSSRLQVIGSAQVTSSIEAYGKVSFNGASIQQATSRFSQRDLSVQEAYLLAHRVGGSPVSVQVGRQRFRDTREWFYDEYMDAIRASVSHGAWSGDVALADGVFAGSVATRSRSDKRHWLGSLTRQLGARGRATAFLVRRNDTGPGDDDPSWLGGSGDWKFEGGSRLWALGAARRGHRLTSQLRGWAIDAGGTWVMPDLSGTPSLTFGLARASGDSVSGDGRDDTFRQTALEDNSARFGGLRRITYYGELFDPELSNLQVWTLGGGLRPTGWMGADLVLHRYEQAVARTSLPSSAFDLSSTGRDRLLGHEVDGAVTFRFGRVDLDVAAGAFISGPGLAGERRVAAFWRPYLRIYF